MQNPSPNRLGFITVRIGRTGGHRDNRPETTRYTKAQTALSEWANSGSVNQRQMNRQASVRVLPSWRLGKGKAKEHLHGSRRVKVTGLTVN